MLPGGNIGGDGILQAGGHLAGDKTLPDQLIQLVLVGGKAFLQLGGRQLDHGGADGLVAVLSVGFGAERPRLRQGVAAAVGLFDIIVRCRKRFGGNAQRVGSHVGDKADGAHLRQVDPLVQLLRDLHGALGLKAEPAGGILLEGRGDKGRRRAFLPGSRFDAFDDKRLFFGSLPQGLGLLAGGDLLLFAIAAVVFGEEGFGLAVLLGQLRFQRPVFHRLEGADLLLPVHHQAYRHRLHPSGRKTFTDLFPQKRTDLVAHKAIQHPPGLLGVHQLLVDAAGMLHAVADPGFGYLIKGDPVGLMFIQLEQLRQMPGNGLSFPIGVGGQVDIVALFGFGTQLFDKLALSLDIFIIGGKVVLDIDAEAGSRQVAHMAHRRHDLIIGAEVFLDGMGFGRGFYNY